MSIPVWGLAKAASQLTKANKGKKKVQLPQVREVLSQAVKFDAASLKAGEPAEIFKAYSEALAKKAGVTISWTIIKE